jgi:hypothetical protein
MVAGCFTSAVGQVDEQRRVDIMQDRDVGLSKMILPSCADDPAAPPQPPSQRRMRENPSMMQSCGMVEAEMLSDAYIAAFVRDVCNGADSPGCAAKLHDTFIARLQERYTFTDWNAVATRCRAHPVECKSWLIVELWAGESHNDGVLAWSRARMEQTNANYAAAYQRAASEDADRRARFAGAMQAIGNAMAQPAGPTVHCTSTTYGTMTNTTCH